MTTKFYSIDNRSLYADTDGATPKTSIWPAELVTKYSPDVASHISSDLGVPVSEFQGLDETLLSIDTVVQNIAANSRTQLADRLRGVLA